MPTAGVEPCGCGTACPMETPAPGLAAPTPRWALCTREAWAATPWPVHSCCGRPESAQKTSPWASPACRPANPLEALPGAEARTWGRQFSWNSLGVRRALKSPCLPGLGSLIVPFPGGVSLGDGRRQGRAFPCPSASPGSWVTGLSCGAGSPQPPPPAVGTACFTPRGWRPQGQGVQVHGVTLPPPGPELGPIPPGLRALPSPWGVSGSPSFLPAGRTPSVGVSPFPLRAQALPACWGGEEGAWTCRKDPTIASR